MIQPHEAGSPQESPRMRRMGVISRFITTELTTTAQRIHDGNAEGRLISSQNETCNVTASYSANTITGESIGVHTPIPLRDGSRYLNPVLHSYSFYSNDLHVTQGKTQMALSGQVNAMVSPATNTYEFEYAGRPDREAQEERAREYLLGNPATGLNGWYELPPELALMPNIKININNGKVTVTRVHTLVDRNGATKGWIDKTVAIEDLEGGAFEAIELALEGLSQVVNERVLQPAGEPLMRTFNQFSSLNSQEDPPETQQ